MTEYEKLMNKRIKLVNWWIILGLVLCGISATGMIMLLAWMW